MKSIYEIMIGIILGFMVGYIYLWIVAPDMAFGSPLDSGYMEKEESEEISGMTSIIIHKQVEQRKEREIEQLAKLIHAEAGNQDDKGKRLVADTVMNRKDSEDFPDTIEEIIFQSGQFAVIDNGSFKKSIPTEEEKRIAAEEYRNRVNNQVLYFTAGNYGKYGTPMFRWKDHYFSK